MCGIVCIWRTFVFYVCCVADVVKDSFLALEC